MMVARSIIDLYYNVGRPDAALQQLDRHLVYLVRNGRGREVPLIMNELIDERPNDAGLVDRMVRLKIHQGKKEQAIALLDQLGEAQIDAGETEEAIATIEKIIALEPEEETKYADLIESLRSAGEIENPESDAY